MSIRQRLGLTVALAWCLSSLPLGAQAGKPQPQQPRQPDPDTVTLVRAVDTAIVDTQAAAEQATSGELALTWESAHFIRGQNGTYVPFTVRFDAAAVRTSEIAVYIRAIPAGQFPMVVAALTPPSADSSEKPKAPPEMPKYAWDNIHFIPKPADGRLTRAIALPPGDYVVYVAVKERSSAGATPPAAPMPRMGLLRHSLTAPDFGRAELQTSSVILASAVEQVTGQLTPAEQEANPYVFGPIRVVPARDARFRKSGELQVIFWVYGATATPAGKPDVTIEYHFHLKQPDGSEKYFNKTEPQELNAQSLPPEFNVAAGHQLPGSLVVGLTPFPEGDYRLEIRVTDKPTGKVVTQNVNFTVTT